MIFFGPFFFLMPLLALVVAARIFSILFRRVFYRRIERLSDNPAPAPAPSPAATDRYEGRAFALAYRLGGRLTVSDVVIDMGLGTKEAEALLDRMTDEVRVRVTVSDDGFVRYEFPEIIDRLRREGK